MVQTAARTIDLLREQRQGTGISDRMLTEHQLRGDDNARVEGAIAYGRSLDPALEEKTAKILSGAFDKISGRTATIAGEGVSTTVRGGGSSGEIEAHGRAIVATEITESGIAAENHGHVHRVLTDDLAYRARSAHAKVETELLRREGEKKTEAKPKAELEPKTEVAATSEGRGTKVPHGRTESDGLHHGVAHGEAGSETELAGLSDEQRAAVRGKIITGVRGTTATGTTTAAGVAAGETYTLVAGNHTESQPAVSTGRSASAHTDTAGTEPTHERGAKPAETFQEKLARIKLTMAKLDAQLGNKTEAELALS